MHIQLLFLTWYHWRQVVFSQVWLVDHVDVHGGRAVDKRAPEGQELTKQLKTWLNNLEFSGHFVSIIC